MARICKLNGQPGETSREAEIITPSCRRQKRPINLFIPLESGGGEQEGEEPAVQENLQQRQDEKESQETNEESEETQVHGRYSLRPTRIYPVEVDYEQYGDEILTVNTIAEIGGETTTEQHHNTQTTIAMYHYFSMNRVRRYMEQLIGECRKFMEEEDVQTSLEADYYMITNVIEDASELAKEFKNLRSKILTLKDEDTKEFEVEACEWFQKATGTVMKISSIRNNSMLLWELYTLLVQTGFASVELFKNKPRAEGRPINRETTNAISLSEAQELGQIIADFRAVVKTEFHGYIELPSEPNVKIVEIDQTTSQPSACTAPAAVTTSAAQSDLLTPALEEYLGNPEIREGKKLDRLVKNHPKTDEVKKYRVDKLEEELKQTKSELLEAVTEMGRKMEVKIEVTIEAQNQQLVLVKKLCEAKETPAKDEI
ncbi:hypothetical protein ANCDUO_09432 [Ancylostoma duodenale]|uniref:Uncharacterized protein n=1 Tax=Ancylostoma duodenale TaxID=51022 RepID=A0A0C2GGM6_9BILA|nr:hypothetical protein ANCDUO_09432 [Ancylostoma duodenale]